MTDKDPNTTGIIEDLFDTLRSYTQSSKTTDEDLLRQRARQYAKLPKADNQITGETHTILTFTLADAVYGLAVETVRGVRPLPKITRVPSTPPYFTGVVNVRGEVITLLDLGVFFGMSGRMTDSKPQELIIVAEQGLQLGFAVQRVRDVLVVPVAELTTLGDTQYTLGIYRRDDTPITILDIHELYRDERLNSEANSE